jgi:hypothetical protein
MIPSATQIVIGKLGFGNHTTEVRLLVLTTLGSFNYVCHSTYVPLLPVTPRYVLPFDVYEKMKFLF